MLCHGGPRSVDLGPRFGSPGKDGALGAFSLLEAVDSLLKLSFECTNYLDYTMTIIETLKYIESYTHTHTLTVPKLLYNAFRTM